jgi:formylmethanofuran dehydrogenase subunit C
LDVLRCSQISGKGRDATTPRRLAASKRFKGYKPETRKAFRKAEVMESETLKSMKDAWRSFDCDLSEVIDTKKRYRSLLHIVEKLSYAATDVERFSYALEEFQNERYFHVKAGLFLSALINNGNDSDYVIHVKHLEIPLWRLGYENEKNIVVNGNPGNYFCESMIRGRIVVNGDVDDCVGAWMKGGSILIRGNAGTSVGDLMTGGNIVVDGNVRGHLGKEMESGNIVVKGNGGDYAGFMMRGGSITVNGNLGDDIGDIMMGGNVTVNGDAGLHIGDRMNAGEIRLWGNFKGLGSPWHGRIYHRGKLIVDK